jgi:hypothetical protein
VKLYNETQSRGINQRRILGINMQFRLGEDSVLQFCSSARSLEISHKNVQICATLAREAAERLIKHLSATEPATSSRGIGEWGAECQRIPTVANQFLEVIFMQPRWKRVPVYYRMSLVYPDESISGDVSFPSLSVIEDSLTDTYD